MDNSCQRLIYQNLHSPVTSKLILKSNIRNDILDYSLCGHTDHRPIIFILKTDEIMIAHTPFTRSIHDVKFNNKLKKIITHLILLPLQLDNPDCGNLTSLAEVLHDIKFNRRIIKTIITPLILHPLQLDNPDCGNLTPLAENIYIFFYFK